ncbi:uncharacterized protein LOC134530141 [Bacillus rossius redtenbacheri]|uniref:uncharacterized protein LOC134530141 n=1 Tax=Bacillus rossius redtenbacheri TaxID=93214 RepID=UPI002FDCACCB
METSESENMEVSVKIRNKGKKRLLQRDSWRRVENKVKRNSGDSYKGCSGKTVPKKFFKFINECCRKKCFSLFPDEQQEWLFSSFWKLGDKIVQDTYLYGCIEKKEIMLKKSNPIGKNRGYSWRYHLQNGIDRKDVCKAFVLKVLQVSQSRMKTVLRACSSGNPVFKENRGKHTERPNKLSRDVWTKVEEHWAKFPSKQSHYSRGHTERKYFENPDLNVKKMFIAFQQYYFDSTGKTLTMKYSTYHRYFRENSPYCFRQPRTDVCDFCTESKTLLDINQNDPRKTTYRLHLAKVEKYKTLKQEYLAKVKGNTMQDDTLVIEFDYGQNLPIPKLNVTSQFYKRLLWLNVFNVHCHNDSASTFYCFPECDAKKNANSVCSFVYHFTCEKMKSYKNIKNIIFLSDAAGGQNKNITVLRFCSWLSQITKVKVTHMFPVRGHSYCQCDRNFGLYGTLLKRLESIETVEDYLTIIKSARNSPSPFQVLMAAHLVEDWSTALEPLFHKVPKSKRSKFSIQKYVILTFPTTGALAVSASYNAIFEPFIFSVGFGMKSKEELYLKKPARPGLKESKKNDVLSLLKFLKPENAESLKGLLEYTTVPEEDIGSESEKSGESENDV